VRKSPNQTPDFQLLDKSVNKSAKMLIPIYVIFMQPAHYNKKREMLSRRAPLSDVILFPRIKNPAADTPTPVLSQ
jgi:hypothetical protein